MQRGDGEYLPHVLVPRGRNKAKLPGNFSVEFVQYVPSLHAHMEAADLIISHAGSGSLFEALSLHKAVIAVPNSSLMANHQVTILQHAFLLRLRIAERCTNLSFFHNAVHLIETTQSACLNWQIAHIGGDQPALLLAWAFPWQGRSCSGLIWPVMAPGGAGGAFGAAGAPGQRHSRHAGKGGAAPEPWRSHALPQGLPAGHCGRHPSPGGRVKASPASADMLLWGAMQGVLGDVQLPGTVSHPMAPSSGQHECTLPPGGHMWAYNVGLQCAGEEGSKGGCKATTHISEGRETTWPVESITM